MAKHISISEESIINKIYQIRGQRVMLDRDLAEMYGVETKRLKEAVRRNIARFPEDFMFEMTSKEFVKWREDNINSKEDKMGLRYAPFCFTEQGVTMLSCVLNSQISIEVNIQIVRTFTRMRQMLMNHQDIMIKLAKIEKQVLKLDRRTELNEKDIEDVFDAINQLIAKEEKPSAPRNKIGFKK